MRDILLALIIAGSVPVCLFSPYFGVLMWYWVSYFNPHRFTFGFAYNLPVALLVAVPTLIGVVFAKKSLRSLLTLESLLLIGLWGWYTITYVHATSVPIFVGHLAEANYEMDHISKIILMTLVMILVTTTRNRLYGVMLVTGGSLGLLALKGALFGARTAGQARVFGPPDSFLADNNAFGLVINVCLPIMYFLARNEQRKWLRRLLYVCFVSGIVSVLLTYSRGGLLGLTVVLASIIFRSRHKLVAAAAAVFALAMILALAPPAWMQRMGRFAGGDLDETANQRLVSWETAWKFAHDFPLTGGGFDTIGDEFLYKMYQPRALPGGLTASGPHSIYFQLLADQGFVGVSWFIALLLLCFNTLRRTRDMARRLPGATWLIEYTFMIETALLAFITSGAFLGFAYLDIIYQMIGTVAVLKILLRQEIRAMYAESATEESSTDVLEEVASPA
jgi:probable O-glycosylation ligase (exosortase A-associated)